MTEKDKAEETLLWLDWFDIMRQQAHIFATSPDQFNDLLKSQINKQRLICSEIISPTLPPNPFKPRKRKTLVEAEEKLKLDTTN